jgi:cell division protein FtsI (penicillin-binding protein 3)
MADNQSTQRLNRLLWILLVWAAVIFGRLFSLQVIHHDDLARLAAQQQQKTKAIPAIRGSILDRAGQPLAKSLPAESVCVNPQRLPDRGVAADMLAGVLKMDRVALLEKIETAYLRGSGFLWIKRKIDADEAARLRTMNLDWIEFRPEMRRFYPHHSLASHVVGSIGILSADDTEERGTAGVEASFEDDLAGIPGLAQVFTDVKQTAYDSVIARKPEPGSDIMLTIDSNLQYNAEKDLARAIETSGAKTGSIVVMNPYTGEVLAMANYPAFDPNNPPGGTEPAGARSNLAITTPFEPGSVFKIVTITAGLETPHAHLQPGTIINCGNGVYNLFGRIIHDAGRHGMLTMQEVFEKSSNIGAIQVGLKVGDHTMYDYVGKFGFGRKTGIELPGESTGMMRHVEDWTKTSIGSVAMGHEVSTTSLQLAVAGAVIANGGMLVKPTIVLSRQKPGQATERFVSEKPRPTIRPETAIMMRRFMEGVVLRGTGKGLANLRGYTSGGKTGTAQVYDSKAHAYTHRYNASFLGFAPVVNPQIVVAVTLNNTTGGIEGYGGPVAAPVFREVAMSALRMLDVPKDLPDSAVVASAEPADHNDLAIAGLGDGADGLNLPAGSSVTSPPVPDDALHSSVASDRGRRSLEKSDKLEADAPRLLNAALPGSDRGTAAQTSGPKVPNLLGMTLRAVLEESSADGLEVETLGSPETGLVRSQEPPPGAILRPGTRVRVQFAK